MWQDVIHSLTPTTLTILARQFRWVLFIGMICSKNDFGRLLDFIFFPFVGGKFGGILIHGDIRHRMSAHTPALKISPNRKCWICTYSFSSQYKLQSCTWITRIISSKSNDKSYSFFSLSFFVFFSFNPTEWHSLRTNVSKHISKRHQTNGFYKLNTCNQETSVYTNVKCRPNQKLVPGLICMLSVSISTYHIYYMSK